MSAGPVHRTVSRALAAPTAYATWLATGDWLLAAAAGVACALSGCGPDLDQAEARLPLGWKVGAGAAWIAFVGWMLWWLKDAP